MHYVGVDLGATNVRAVLGDGDATLNGRARGENPGGPTGAAIADAVCDVIRTACADAGVEPSDVTAAGIAAMGHVDPEAGVVEVSANVSGDVDRIPLVAPVADLLESDAVSLCNDAVAGAIGARHHSHPDVDRLVYLTISSGIGAGVLDHGVVQGWHGNAGEVGHLTIDHDDDFACGCGRTGHWEAYCGGNNIPRFARHLHASDPVETTLPLDDALDAATVFEHADTDAFAGRVVDELAARNTTGVANVVHAYDPEVISIGGAVALNNPTAVVDPIVDRLPDAVIGPTPEVARCELGDDVVVYGALVTAITGGVAGR